MEKKYIYKTCILCTSICQLKDSRICNTCIKKSRVVIAFQEEKKLSKKLGSIKYSQYLIDEREKREKKYKQKKNY